MTDKVRITSLTQPEAHQYVQAINWSDLMPAIIDLARHIQQGGLVSEWEKTVDIISAILDALRSAEQRAQGFIDWAALLPIILEIILPLLTNLLKPKDPIRV